MTYKRYDDCGIVFQSLQSKFAENLRSALKSDPDLLSRVELKARAIPIVGAILAEDQFLSHTQKEMLCLYDEIFADVVTSSYLAACALDKPAQMMLRRSLELGIAAVYLWDLPHLFWAWKNHDKDLNFKDMIEHLCSQGFRSLLKRENPAYRGADPVDASSANAVYRSLSNVIHGKITTFESVLPDRFQHSATDWKQHLIDVLRVEDLLIQLWKSRFEKVSQKLGTVVPQLEIMVERDK
jgi:hypothetical protein